jgi:UDP-GlcNAc:undecaprenyl-phosphate GlcNAc-1-phosphate transferase
MPIIDTTSVFINRIIDGKSPFIGGKDHTTHALANLGFSERQVAAVFSSITLVSVIIVLIVERYLIQWNHFYTSIFSVYIIILFTFLFYATRIKAHSIKLNK